MNILLIGSGGREHALAWKLAQSPILKKLFIAPGNGGMGDLGEMVQLSVENHDAVINFCQLMAIDLVVVGPEVPLVAGLADELLKASIAVFGPSAAAAQLEGSKHFTKQICEKANIPTAGFGHFRDAQSAKDYLATHPAPIVIKADGLAAGKGVTVAMTDEEALAAIENCFDGALGSAGAEVVLEEFLSGEEASMFFICDGETALPFGTAQDHKRVGDGDTGPNTGGMGAYSPAPVVTKEIEQQVMDRIIIPTMEAMREAGTPFVGVLYAGLMIENGVAKLIEYNVRFGDPECQVLMMRLESDLLPLLTAAANGNLAGECPRWSPDAALTVVMASKGYPGGYDTGDIIKGLDLIDPQNALVFHAGTKKSADDVIASGGRVLNVCAQAATIAQAQRQAYDAVDKIDWPGGFCRRDIGWRAIDGAK